MSLQCLVGSTVYLEFEFFNRIDGITPAPITDPTIKVYDSNQAQIGTTIVLTNANKLSEGKYFYYLTIPNNQPYIDVKMFCLNASDSDVASTRIEVIWSTDDIEDIPQIIITVGTDTYISLADANTYFSKVFGSEIWDNSSDTDKIKSLIQATKSIDSLNLRGRKYDYNQRLEFPRAYANPRISDMDLEIDDIPPRVLDAVCEEAKAILQSISNPTASLRAELQSQGVTFIKNGDSTEIYGKQTSAANKLLSLTAVKYMTPYMHFGITIDEEC